ncbi:MAG: sigma 54-interacting transcriptional regulator [Tepidisphaerales bacterium]
MPKGSADIVSCALQKERGELEMRALYDIARVLMDRSGQRQTLLDILGVLEQWLGMVRGTIMLLGADSLGLEVAAARDAEPATIDSVRYRPGEGIIGRVFQTGQPLAVSSVADDPRFCDRIHGRQTRNLGDVGFICVPILLGSEVVGTLSADVPAKDRHWMDESLRCLTIVAGMIGYDVRARRLEREETQALQDENLRLRSALEEQFRPENMIGNSRTMRDVYLRIRQVAAGDTTVLIRGESGTGKELVASAIHYSSKRAKGPFVRVNCAALSDTLIESELFGHEKGAFTGANQRRIGRIEDASGGTLFLDEIGEFSTALQAKLLRVLQERELERVGSNTPVKVDVRIITATNRDLEKAVQTAAFRRDFYYRINVFPVFMPPLRERRDDILLLANHFAAKYGQRLGKNIHRISTPAINAMIAYHWPGNVRELENCIEHAVLLSEEGVIHSHNLPPTLEIPNRKDAAAHGTLEIRVEALERDMITDALKRSGGSAAAAARELGITARIMRYKIRKLGIDYETLFGDARASQAAQDSANDAQ